MPQQAVDYDALAKKFGAVSSSTPDYDALAAKFGAAPSPPPTTSPTLVASRREASRREFEQNLPAGQRPYEGIRGALGATGAFLREFALGGLERAGIDPTSIPSVVKSGAQGLSQIVNPPSPYSPIDPNTNQPTAPPSDLLSGPKAFATGLGESVHEGAQGIREQDPLKMAHGLGGAFALGKPAAEVGVGLGKAGIEAVASTEAANLVKRRAIQSVLKPDKASVIGEADPIDAVSKLPPSASLRGMKSRVGDAITQRENELWTAIADRRSAAEAAGIDPNQMGIDVEPLLRSRVSGLIQQAIRNGDKGVAAQLERMMEARLTGIRQRLGSTYLTPEQILAEKRMLRDEIDFKPKSTLQQNKNAARLGIYRGFDHALDTLVPAAADINKDYAGLIVGDKLIDARLHTARNADMTHSTLFKTVTAHMPGEVAAKTTISRALTEPFTPRRGPGPPAMFSPPGTSLPSSVKGTIPLSTTSSAYEFHPPTPEPPPSAADIYKGRVRGKPRVGYPVETPPVEPPLGQPSYGARPQGRVPGYPVQQPPPPEPPPDWVKAYRESRKVPKKK